MGVFLAAVLCVAFLATAAGALEDVDLQRIWKANGAVEGLQEFRFGVVDWTEQTAVVQGEAELPPDPTPQQRLLAGRKALVDARRKLLYLLYEMKFGLPKKLTSIEVKGHIVAPHVTRETVSGGRATAQVVIPLRRLFETCVIWEGEAK
ncbi:MAG: hypothetical protein K9L28_03180 [Synergistales bacterium]|nr:hypothetical protein [Synergistales bacterium]